MFKINFSTCMRSKKPPEKPLEICQIFKMFLFNNEMP